MRDEEKTERVVLTRAEISRRFDDPDADPFSSRVTPVVPMPAWQGELNSSENDHSPDTANSPHELQAVRSAEDTDFDLDAPAARRFGNGSLAARETRLNLSIILLAIVCLTLLALSIYQVVTRIF